MEKQTEQGPRKRRRQQTGRERNHLMLDDHEYIHTVVGCYWKMGKQADLRSWGWSSDTDWFNNSYEREGQGCGTIIGESGGKLWILTEKKND